MRYYLCVSLLLCGLATTTPAVDHPAMIRGKVVERRTNEPIAGAIVEVADLKRSTLTDSLGMFVLNDVDSGKHTILVHVHPWGTFRRSAIVNGQTIDVPTIRVWPGLVEASYEGVIAHYALDGNAADDGPNGWDGVNHGASPSEDRHGLAGSAMHFDGRTQRIEIAHRERFNQLPLSISFWVRADLGMFESSTWVGKSFHPGGDGWHIGYQHLTVYGGYSSEHYANFVRNYGEFYPQDASWHHVVLTLTAIRTEMYFDGKRVGEGNALFRLGVGNVRYQETATNALNKEPMFIGYLNTEVETPGLLGSIDDLYVFDHVLSTQEIKELRKK